MFDQRWGPNSGQCWFALFLKSLENIGDTSLILKAWFPNGFTYDELPEQRWGQNFDQNLIPFLIKVGVRFFSHLDPVFGQRWGLNSDPIWSPFLIKVGVRILIKTGSRL